jgi:hypothetical protein
MSPIGRTAFIAPLRRIVAIEAAIAASLILLAGTFACNCVISHRPFMACPLCFCGLFGLRGALFLKRSPESEDQVSPPTAQVGSHMIDILFRIHLVCDV